MANERDVLLRISFALTRQDQATKAAKQLRELGVFQDIVTQKVRKFTKDGTQTTYMLRAMGNTSHEKFSQMSRDIDNTVNKIGRWRTVTSGSYRAVDMSMRNYIHQLTRAERAQRALARTSEQLRRVSWSFTMASMSMLGVFFSMMSFTMLLQRGFNMLAGPMMDIEGAATSVAEAFAFGNLAGENMNETFGDMGGIIQDNVTSWQNLKMLQGKMFLSLNQVGTALFTNQEFVSSLTSLIDEMAIALSDPALVEALSSLALSMVEAIPGFVELVPHVARLMEAMAPFVPMMVATATAAAVLMPIFANVSAAIFILSKVLGVAAGVMGFFVGTTAGASAYVGVVSTLSAVVSTLGTAIAGVSLVTVGWVAAIALIVAAIGYVLYRFGILQKILQKIRELFVWATESIENMGKALMAISGPIGMGISIAGKLGEAVIQDARAQPVGGAGVDRSTTYVTMENNIVANQSTDVDEVTDRLSSNLANRRNR